MRERACESNFYVIKQIYFLFIYKLGVCCVERDLLVNIIYIIYIYLDQNSFSV